MKPPSRSKIIAPLRFFRKPAGEQWMLVEAVVLVGLLRFVIRFLPFRVLKAMIGRPVPPDQSAPTGTVTGAASTANISKADAATVEIALRAVVAVSRRVPWESKCLVQASVTKIMLRRRGIGSILCLGIRKPGAKPDADQKSAGAGPKSVDEPQKATETIDITAESDQESAETGQESADKSQNTTGTRNNTADTDLNFDGFLRNSTGRPLQPHAWLIVGGEIVLGGGMPDHYVTVSRFV